MTLYAYKTLDIDKWESQLLSAAAELRKIRLILQENDLPEVELEATRASDMIEKIEGWALEASGKAKKFAAAEAAKKTREMIKARRAGKSKS